MSHVTARRRENGVPLRAAVKEARLTIQALAARTAERDPAGKGVSWQAVAFTVTAQKWARETTSPRTAALIEDALGAAQGTFFVRETVYAKHDKQPGFDDL